ncbi:MAG TPA: cytochrome d ubiquinol oxidase subunit II [Flavisolibacter sp.]|nr:cytochrome d ubiquinol oxidase subunit II [Flavisolibacter sp.]
MKRTSLLILVLLVLSGIAGYLLSKASLVGRMGISLFYKQYAFLKMWWQGGLLIFIVWLVLFALQGWAQRKLSPAASRLLHLGAIVVALIGLYLTYQDFRQSLSHRWLGERFHLGGYLFWIGWMLVSLFYLSGNKKQRLPENQLSDNHTKLPSKSEREQGM